MANKFTKSILERQAKEAKEHPKTAEPPKQPTPEAADTPQQLPPSENTVATEKQAAQLQLDQLLETELQKIKPSTWIKTSSMQSTGQQKREASPTANSSTKF